MRIAFSFTCNPFFAIFALSLINIFNYETITDQQFD